MTDERVEPTDDFVRRLSGIRPCLGTEFCRTHDQYLSDCVAYFEQEKQRITAILASQPERVECPNGDVHKMSDHAIYREPPPSNPFGREVVGYELDEFCSRCGQSLKGAGNND